MKKTIFFKIITFILFALPVSSLFSMKREQNVWAQDKVMQYVIRNANDEVQTINIKAVKEAIEDKLESYIENLKEENKKIVPKERNFGLYALGQLDGKNLKPWRMWYKKVRPDLIIVQLPVTLQKILKDECFIHSIYFSSLFAKTNSPKDYLLKIWKDTNETRNIIENVRKEYAKKYGPGNVTTVLGLIVKEGIFNKVNNSGLYKMAIQNPSDIMGKDITGGEYIPGISPEKSSVVKYFHKERNPLMFVLSTSLPPCPDLPKGGSGHVISGRIEWVPNTNTKILFFSDSWYPTTCVIDKYAKEFMDLIGALVSKD